MKHNPTSNRKDFQYKKVAEALEAEIMEGTIPDGTHLPNRSISERFRISPWVTTNVSTVLRGKGLLEYKVIDGKRNKARGNFVKSPESPQGGSPERR